MPVEGRAELPRRPRTLPPFLNRHPPCPRRSREPLAWRRHALTTRLNYFSSSRAHTIAPTGWLNLRAVSALRSISSIATPTPGGGRQRTSPRTKYTTSFANVFYAVSTRLSLLLYLAVLSRSRGSSCPSHRRTADHLRCARA